MITDEAYEAATRAGDEFYANDPHAVGARHDADRQRIVVELSNGTELTFAARDAQGLEHGTPEQLAEVQIDGVGFGLHWPSLDADLYIPSLLKGITGTKAWMEKRGKLQAAE